MPTPMRSVRTVRRRAAGGTASSTSSSPILPICCGSDRLASRPRCSPRRFSEDALAALEKMLGPKRAAHAFPVAELASETRLLLGSGWHGWPGESLDPIQVLDRAVNGLDAEDLPAEAPALEKPAGLKIKAAIDAYTSTAAWGSFDDQRKGTISQGMLADLVVLSDDVLTKPARLKTASVLATIFDGKIVYRRDALALTAPAPSLQH